MSIIVPCFNQSQYLGEALQSVSEQTYTDWECIIVNDGSPDDTEEVSKEWCEKDARFKYLYKENGGLSSARNAGIAVAGGEYILPLDADDKIAPEYAE
ncbi:MAG TPA: glycosyltransferase family 2 protein, partial [Flavobacterium sp.]|nr:glycosyltransferase family 2 protein [Flavobacterium sp.]